MAPPQPKGFKMSVWGKIKKAIKKNIVPIAASPFTAGASLAFLKDSKGNTVLDHVTGAASAREQNRKNRELQEQTNALSIELANTAHQREVQDLQAAGLNPVLSAGGNGAATPQLGTAQVENEMPGGYLAQAAQVANIANTFSSAKQASSAANLQKEEAKTIPSQIALNESTTAKNLADAGYSKAQIEFYNDTGVFPGANISTTGGFNTIFGGGHTSTTTPIKNKNKTTSARKNN